MIESAAHLLVRTVEELSRRAPAIVAAASSQMGDVVLGLHFGDDSKALLRAERSRLIARAEASEAPDVEVYFDDRSLNLLFDLEHRPVDEVWGTSLDVRGSRSQVLAVWRTFQLLSQRASGLRAVQGLWRAYRDGKAELWGTTVTVSNRSRNATPSSTFHDTGWRALDYLGRRHPEHLDRHNGNVGGTVHLPGRSIWDGWQSHDWWEIPSESDADLMETLAACKIRVQEELERIIPDREPKKELYDLMRKYPAREGKGLRPTLTIATCSALGGSSEDGLRTAAAIELFHNGFLVHDDISDESEFRRHEATLHESHGVGLAVNTGDAMNLLAIDSVLSNLPTLGLARTLGLIHEVMHMCRETVEGQAIELGWIRSQTVPPRDEDYYLMSTKKTGWYTCISPCRMGAVVAGVTDPLLLDRFNEAFRLIGIAFQIQDDVLNLLGEEALYGKEPLGDLLEGKRTVMLIHLFRTVPTHVRDRLAEIIRTPRKEKRFADAEKILGHMKEYGSLDYAIDLADRLAHQGVARFEKDLLFVDENEAKGVLRQIANYVTTRAL